MSEPESFTPGDTSSFDEEDGKAVAFEITLTNGTDENFDPGSVFPTLRSGSTEASEIYDYEQLGDRPSTTLLPGDEAVWKDDDELETSLENIKWWRPTGEPDADPSTYEGQM